MAREALEQIADCTYVIGAPSRARKALAQLDAGAPVAEKDCPDCQAAKRHAYSDATTPGFFFTQCDKHRAAGKEG